MAARPRLRISPSLVSFTSDKRESSRRLTPESFCCSESSRAISASSRAAISAFPMRSLTLRARVGCRHRFLRRKTPLGLSENCRHRDMQCAAD
nr:MAG TPA: hypothetical protein [Caudoviricetes sp.]